MAFRELAKEIERLTGLSSRDVAEDLEILERKEIMETLILGQSSPEPKVKVVIPMCEP